MLTKAAAVDLTPYNIRANSIHPGLVQTPMLEDNPAALDVLLGPSLIRRPAHTREISNIVLLLASDESNT